MGKIRVEELARQMGVGSKEVLFLLQSIGVDVRSPHATLDESTVLGILQGRTQPKPPIVGDTEPKPVPPKGALSRIKIIEKTPPPAPRLSPAKPEEEPPHDGPRPTEPKAAPKLEETAYTAVAPPEPEPKPPSAEPGTPPAPLRIALPPRPSVSQLPSDVPTR
jgi:translation initiation factor IF-2